MTFAGALECADGYGARCQAGRFAFRLEGGTLTCRRDGRVVAVVLGEDAEDALAEARRDGWCVPTDEAIWQPVWEPATGELGVSPLALS